MSAGALTLGQALQLQDELEAMEPPQDVALALRRVVVDLQAGWTTSRDLVNYVQDWVGKSQRQDKYGK